MIDRTTEPVPESGRRFAEAGEAAVRRLGLVHMVRYLKMSALPVCGGGLLLILSLRYFGVRWADWIAALLLVGSWVAASALFAMWRRPTRFAALAAWDENAGRNETLASAEFFEMKGDLVSEGEKLHLARSRQILDEAGPQLRKHLPLPRMTWQWVLPLLVLAFSFSPLLKPQVGAEDRKLSEEANAVAKAEAEKLVKDLEGLEKAKGLSAEEKEKYDEVVKQAKDMAAKELQEAGDKSTREILKELEERARAAEKLARELGGEDDRWASEQMLDEMARHADTADLAEAIRAKKPTRSANEAREVADILKSDALTKEVEGRMDKALEKTAGKADEKDVKKPVGKHFETASRRMEADKIIDAAAEFEKLAREFDTKAQRERAKQQMQKLAEQLRKAGSKIAGKNMGGMQKLAGNKKNQMNLQKMPLGFQQNQMQKLGKSQAMRLQNMPMMQMQPGMKPGKPGKGKPMAMMPIPGMQPKPGMGKAMVPGMGMKPGAGMGAVPVPGMGAGQGMGMAALGGLQAGAGTTALGNDPSKAEAARLNSTVNAKINADGDVSMRAVEGEVRGEAAARAASAERVEFVKVQEEALDEATLPSSRRAHVKRYFDLLREQFEAQDSK
jgi:hypothetical protein